MKKPLMLLLALFLTTPVWSDTEELPPYRSILILFDLSFSMQMKDHESGLSRLAAAGKAIKALLNKRDRDEEWALATFTDRDSIEIRQAFTEQRERIIKELPNLKVWGTSPIEDALEFARNYLSAEGRGREKIILLVSDGIATESRPLDLPDLKRIIQAQMILFLLGFNLEKNPPLFKDLAPWTRSTGGDFFTVGQIDELSKALSRAHAMEPGQVKQEESSGEAGNRALSRPLFWLFLTAFLILLVIFFRSSSRWSARIKDVKSSLKKQYILKIQIRRVSDGKNILSNFDYFPVTAGFTKEADILLPTRERLQCKIDLKEDEACFSSDKMILVNGVARREKRLKLGDCILFDGYRLFFKGLSISEPPLPERPFPQFIWQIPVLILFLTLSFLFLPAGRKAMTRTAGTVGQEQYPLPVLSLSDPLVIEPGLKPQFFKADIMFVHAHPDDESLDFGALMTGTSRSGRRTVTILFTDGEAGLDRYPHRQVGGDYPNHRLKGRPLADVRVEEARKALAVLGSEVYVRLGLKNHPYGGILDIIELPEVIRRWGGEEKLIHMLLDLMRGYRPKIVISPDSRSKAYEHFEHEAVGYIVQKTITLLRERGEDFLKGHLVSVDPLQTATYSQEIGINAMLEDQESGLSYRAIQARALKEHITQRDASVIGLERIPNFALEYYQPKLWDLSESVEEYFGPNR